MLAEALHSVWAQRLADYELIVVDDGSTDDTPALLAAHEGRLAWHRQDHGGPGTARNLGARHAKGVYLAFLDSDDRWFPWTLQAYARAIDAAAHPALVVGTAAPFRAAADLDRVVESPLEISTFADYYAAHDQWRCWGAGFCVIRHDVFTSAGGFTDATINGEDADLVMRIGAAPGFVQVNAPCTFGYRAHAGTAMARLDRTIAGAWYLLAGENAGRYPGGEARAWARRQILATHLRSLMLQAAQQGYRRDAWRLYRATFGWHIGLRRWRFLVAFPLLAARRPWTAPPAAPPPNA
jgi:glycosyltransferase involved in cell wall biosynthesis